MSSPDIHDFSSQPPDLNEQQSEVFVVVCNEANMQLSRQDIVSLPVKERREYLVGRKQQEAQQYHLGRIKLAQNRHQLRQD